MKRVFWPLALASLALALVLVGCDEAQAPVQPTSVPAAMADTDKTFVVLTYQVQWLTIANVWNSCPKAVKQLYGYDVREGDSIPAFVITTENPTPYGYSYPKPERAENDQLMAVDDWWSVLMAEYQWNNVQQPAVTILFTQGTTVNGPLGYLTGSGIDTCLNWAPQASFVPAGPVSPPSNVHYQPRSRIQPDGGVGKSYWEVDFGSFLIALLFTLILLFILLLAVYGREWKKWAGQKWQRPSLRTIVGWFVIWPPTLPRSPRAVKNDNRIFEVLKEWVPPVPGVPFHPPIPNFELKDPAPQMLGVGIPLPVVLMGKPEAEQISDQLAKGVSPRPVDDPPVAWWEVSRAKKAQESNKYAICKWDPDLSTWVPINFIDSPTIVDELKAAKGEIIRLKRLVDAESAARIAADTMSESWMEGWETRQVQEANAARKAAEQRLAAAQRENERQQRVIEESFTRRYQLACAVNDLQEQLDGAKKTIATLQAYAAVQQLIAEAAEFRADEVAVFAALAATGEHARIAELEAQLAATELQNRSLRERLSLINRISGDAPEN